ncbi:hypothetical protein SLA2020_275260 [Shorea laevis]
MPDHADHLRDFVDSAWRCCSLLVGCSSSLISRHYTELVGSSFDNFLSQLIEEKESHYSKHIPVMDFIDISSSDEDLEEIDGKESAISRILPSWASTHGTNSRTTGFGVQSQKINSPKRAYASNGSSSNHSQEKLHLHPGSSDNIRIPIRQIAQVEDSDYFTDNGNVSQPWTVNSRIASLSGADFEKISSQQALTRTLPPSLQSSAPIIKLGNKGSSQVRDTHDTYYSAGPSVTSGKGYLRDQFSRSKNDEVIMYNSNGTRILPPS